MTEQDKNQQSDPLPSMTERNPERHRLKRRKEFLIGTVVAVCLLAAGAGLIRYFVAKNQPADIVRTCLRSYGPLTVVQLQSTLVPRLMPEAEWKEFWELSLPDWS